MTRRSVALLLAAALATAALPSVPAAATGGVVVSRVAGEDRVGTAVAASRFGWDGAERAVVAAAHGFADALAAGPLAAGMDAPLLLVGRDHLPEAVADELVRLGVAEVVIVGGTAAVGEAVAEAIAAISTDPTVRRIDGADRYATAAAVARETGAAAHVVVASGAGFADALAATNLTSADAPVPVLLTDPTALPEATRDALAELAPQRAVIAGGAAAVSDEVAAAVGEVVGDVVRIGGADRYGTALALLDAALLSGRDPGPLVVATGNAFPDALAAGPLAAHLRGFLLLTPTRRLTDPADTLVRDRPDQFTTAAVVGGPVAVSDFAQAEVEAALSGSPRPGFTGSFEPVPAEVRERMTGVSWRDGCPVELDDLALLHVDHWGFDDQVHRGRIVVHADVAEQVLGVFARLFDAGFPLERVELVDVYGDDDASMAANNTSGFNCRTVAGTSTWSQHAYGLAVDLNPVQNPYVRGDRVDPPAGRDYLDRHDVRPGMIVRPGPVVEAFDSIGWGWGGDWSSAKDYQHFSANGR